MFFEIKAKNGSDFTLDDLRVFVAKSARLPGNIPVRLADDNSDISIKQIIGDEESVNVYLN